MATKKTGLDDFDFDDLNFDNLDAQEPTRRQNNDGPIRKMSKTFGEGAKEAMLDPRVVRRFASAALPDGYGTTINVASDISDGVAELYHNAASELRPAMPAMRRAAAKIASGTKNILPKALRDKLEEFSKDPETYRAMSQEEAESNQIAQELGGVFAAAATAQVTQLAQDSAERKLRDRVSDKLSMASARSLHAIRESNDRLVAYQDQVTLKFQQKSLELQYRQLFTTKSIFELQKHNSQRDFEFMQAVLRNTSMSDGAKAAAELKEDSKLVNRLKHQFQQSIVKHFGSFGQQIQQNITNSLRSAMGGFSEALMMGDDAAAAVKDAQEMGADISVGGEIGRMLGRGITEGVMRLLANPLRSKLNQNKKLTGLGARLNYIAQNLPEHITRWSRTNTDGDSVRSYMINLLKEMVPRKGLDNSLGESSVFTADAPASYTKRTDRTINEVLPGWLMRIHHELMKIRSGRSDIEPMTYNLMRGNFSSAEDARKDVLRQVFNPRTIGHARTGLDDFITKQLDPEGKLSKSAREALKRQLFMDTVKGELFDPERLTNEGSDLTELLGDQRSEVAGLIRGRFMTGDRDDDSISRDRTNTKFVGLRNLIPDVKSSMGAWRDLGQKDLLMQSGLMDSVMGHDSINYQRVMEMILQGAESEHHNVEERRGAMDQIKLRAESLIGNVGSAAQDIYANGVESPVLQAVKIKAGEYRDAFTKQVITTVDEIKGPLIDRYNNVVLTSRDFGKGLVDASGQQLRALVERARDNTDTLYQQHLASPAPMGQGGGLAQPQEQNTHAASNEPSQLVQLNAQQVELLTSIHEILATRNFMIGPGEGGPIDEQQRKSWMMRVRNMPRNIKTSLVKGTKNAWGLLGTGLAKLSRGSWWATKKVGGLYGSYVKGVGKLAVGVVKTPLRAVGSLFGFSSEFFNDIYIKGQKEPALYAKKLKQGLYQDKATGKVIKSIRDIKGEVVEMVNGQPNVVLTQADFESGLYDSRGRKLARYLFRGGIGLGKTILSGYGALVQLPFMMLRGIAKLASTGLSKFFAQRDIYVPGDSQPRMRAILIERGEYRSVKTGKTIRKHQDIDGAVWDSKDNEVISDEEFRKGLVDVSGRPIGTWAERVGGSVVRAGAFVARQAGRLVKGYAQVVGGILGFGKNTLLGMLKGVGGIFDPTIYSRYNERVTDLLEAIHDLLDKRIPDNGQGRAGSWQSQLKSRAELQKLRTGKKTTDKEGKEGGVLSKLLGKGKAGLLGLLGMGGGEEEDDGGSLLNDAGDAAAIYDAANGDGTGRDRRKRRRGRGRLGRMGRGLQSAKAMGGKGLGKLGGLFKRMPKGKVGLGAAVLGGLGLSAVGDNMGGTTGTALETASNVWTIASLARMFGLWGGAGAAAAGTGGAAAAGATGAAGAVGAAGATAAGAGTVVGGGAATVLGLPLVAAGAVIGAVGYAGYKTYKTYKYGTYIPLRSYRMAQYGIPYTDADQVKTIVEFEQMLEPHVKGIGGRLDVAADGISMQDVYKHFDIDDGWFTNNSEERKGFDIWFNQRFKPVFVAWRNSLNTIKVNLPLNDADESLSGEQKLAVLKAAHNINRATYMVMVGPFGRLDLGVKEVEDAYTVANHSLEKEKKNGGTGWRDKLERFSVASMRLSPIPFSGYFAEKTEEMNQQRRLGEAKEANPNAAKSAMAIGFLGAKSRGLRVSDNLTALDAVRYRTYGLKDMERDRVRALAELELEVAPHLHYNQNGQARYEGDPEVLFNMFAPQFGVGQPKRADWMDWFQNRFLPTLIAFGSAVRRFSSAKDPIEASHTLKPEQKMEVAQMLQTAQRSFLLVNMSVWSYTISPWEDYVLNTDPRTIHDNLTALKEAVKKRLLTEDKGAAAGGRGAKGAANVANAESAQRRQQQTSVMDRIRGWVFGDNQQKNVLDRAYTGAVTAVDQTRQAASNAASGNWSMFGQNVTNASTAMPRALIGGGSAKLADGRNISGLNVNALWQKVAPLIASGESMGGNYEAQNGVPRNITPGLSRMTIGQVYELSRSIGRSDGNGPKTGAAGKYQFIPPTLLAAMKKAKLTLQDLFSPENQEKMGRVLFDQRVAAGAAGGVVGILDQLAMEWASLPSPTKGGRSWYHGDSAGNRAHGGQKRLEELIAAVTNTKEGASSTTPGGKPDVANMAPSQAQKPAAMSTSPAWSVVPKTVVPAPVPMLEITSPNRSRSAEMLAAAPGYASALDVAAKSNVTQPGMSKEQDTAVLTRRAELAQQARAQEMRSEVADRDRQRQTAVDQEVQSAQLKTQEEMRDLLKDIKVELKSMNGSMIAASSQPADPKTTDSGESKMSRLRTPRETPRVPISMKHRTVR